MKIQKLKPTLRIAELSASPSRFVMTSCSLIALAVKRFNVAHTLRLIDLFELVESVPLCSSAIANLAFGIFRNMDAAWSTSRVLPSRRRTEIAECLSWIMLKSVVGRTNILLRDERPCVVEVSCWKRP